MRVTADGDSSVMSTLIQSVPYGPFIQKIECAYHACKCYRSRLEAFARDHPQFCGKGGLTKRAIQKLTVGAWMAIQMHSRTGNILQLHHDLRNGPAHVFENHSKCNPNFCKHATSSSTCSPLPPPAAADSDLADEHGLSSTDDDPDHNNFSDMIDTIIAAEESDEPTTSEEADAQTGQSSMLESLPEGLFTKVLVLYVHSILL